MVTREWWKEAVVYQVYPRSFNDTDGDGIGDIPGVVKKVDYLDDLGIDVVWLNPVYESPMADNGYDISDYRSINPEFGDMADWEQLLSALHDRDMRLVMDLVVNHTSDEHEWFVKSRMGDPEYADYYHWRPGDGDGNPNNWESLFGGPAWSYDETRDEYYLHLFDEKQPDLNWRNEDVREAVHDVMRWWLEKGIDGFRMDVINLISKAEGLPDGDPESGLTGAEHFIDGPRTEDYLGEMNEEVLSQYDVMTVGEMVGVDAETATRYVGEDGCGLSMVIHFEHMNVDAGEDKWDVRDLDLLELKTIVTDWQEALADDGWNCLYLSNHDQPRAVSRFGDDGQYRVESATMLATFLFALQGTPFVYQGQEIGMTNTTFETPAEIRDVEAENFVENALESGEYDSYEDLRPALEAKSRDNARTPMQWTDDEHAGFSEVEPWIAVNDNYERINVEAARSNPDSIWNYYRKLIELRDDSDLLVYGDYDLCVPDHPEVFAFERTFDGQRLVVLCNFFADTPSVDLPLDPDEASLVLGNYDEPPSDPSRMRPYESRMYETPGS